MNRRTFMRNGLMMAAPWAALVVLVVMPIILPIHVQATSTNAMQRQHVAQTMENVPLQIGDWRGEDRVESVPPAAHRLLRPNAIFYREYRKYRGSHPSSFPVYILFVHCGDARDMTGHYPPKCYPNAGWLQTEQSSREPQYVTLVTGVHALPVRVFEFKRLQETGWNQGIRIYNAFILPDGTVTADIRTIQQQAGRVDVALQGVTQLQFIMPIDTSHDEMMAAAEELLGGMQDLLEALGLQRGAVHDS
jgi:hypothetical protein